jgi:hypothetical protein
MNILFRAYFGFKKIPEENCPKIYLGEDPGPDQDVFKSRIRIRIWSKIVLIRNTAFRRNSSLDITKFICHSKGPETYYFLYDRKLLGK